MRDHKWGMKLIGKNKAAKKVGQNLDYVTSNFVVFFSFVQEKIIQKVKDL